jgi:hypothetical protein
MYSKKDIETVLRINGVDPTSPVATISAVLKEAGYTDTQIEDSLSVLSGRSDGVDRSNPAAQNLLRTEQPLKPQDISGLLGIDINISTIISAKDKRKDLSTSQVFLVIFLSIFSAVAAVLISMYLNDVGFFHPTVSAFGK